MDLSSWAGDTAWVPRCSAGRTAGSAGPRRRNAQLRWAMRGQDPLKEQRVPGSAGLLGDRTPEPQAKGSSVSLEKSTANNHIRAIQQAVQEAGLDGWLVYEFRRSEPLAGRLLELAAHR